MKWVRFTTSGNLFRPLNIQQINYKNYTFKQRLILLDYIYLCDLWFKKPIYPTEIRASNIIPVDSKISLQFLIIEKKLGT